MKSIFKSISLLSLIICLNSCNLLTAAGISSNGQPTKKVDGELNSVPKNSAINIDHSEWDKLLKKHVNDKGFVDYKALKKDRTALDSYLSMLAKNEPTNDWSVQELLAYYINLYNAETVALILDNYPTKSIKDIDSPWLKNRFKIGGKDFSLAGLENGILLKMNEPRVHFAINCASVSCPKLLNVAYTGSNVMELMERATKEFINNSTKNELSTNKAKISKIFKWYSSDFTKNGTVLDYINKYSDTKINANTEIEYIDYDWSLNEQK